MASEYQGFYVISRICGFGVKSDLFIHRGLIGFTSSTGDHLADLVKEALRKHTMSRTELCKKVRTWIFNYVIPGLFFVVDNSSKFEDFMIVIGGVTNIHSLYVYNYNDISKETMNE